ncbi:MAG: hypothetical protein ACR2K3_11370 [Nocardioides sp.]
MRIIVNWLRSVGPPAAIADEPGALTREQKFAHTRAAVIPVVPLVVRHDQGAQISPPAASSDTG